MKMVWLYWICHKMEKCKSYDDFCELHNDLEQLKEIVEEFSL